MDGPAFQSMGRDVALKLLFLRGNRLVLEKIKEEYLLARREKLRPVVQKDSDKKRMRDAMDSAWNRINEARAARAAEEAAKEAPGAAGGAAGAAVDGAAEPADGGGGGEIAPVDGGGAGGLAPE